MIVEAKGKNIVKYRTVLHLTILMTDFSHPLWEIIIRTAARQHMLEIQ